MALYRWLFLYGFLKGICDGCETGTYLDNGECRQCRTNCSSCIVESECVSCKAGFYGKSCSYQCPNNCHDLECDKESGLCLSCIKGYFINGQKMCDQCPENCTTCNSKNYCFACKSGSKGTACEGECSSCKEGSSCDKNTGYCFESCKDGQSGELCDLSCNSNCLTCDRLNDNNCTACARNRHGIACNETCPSACLNNTCNRTNGLCSFGCSLGFWGHTCNKGCPVNCINCEIENGTCLKCANGFYGSNCSLGQNKGIVTTVLTVGSVVLVIIVAAIACACCRKRWNCRCFCLKCCLAHKDTVALYMLSNAADNSPSHSNSTKQINADEASETNERENLLGDEEDGSQIKPKLDYHSEKAGNHYSENTQEGNQYTSSDVKNADNEKNSIQYIDVVGYKEQTRKYIASFGPMTAITKDISGEFWVKVWQIRCNIIVMLTDLKDTQELLNHFETQQKQGNMTIGPASDKRNETHLYTINLALGEDNTNTDTRTIKLAIFHYWSDKWSLGNRQKLRDFYMQYSNADPIMVYCSNQVDRCGTFIAFDMLKNEKQTDIEDCVNHLKNKGLDMSRETQLLRELLSDQ